MGRNIALDILKLLMAFMIVGIHAEFLKDINLAWSYFTAYGIFRIAVPVFLLINGFFFYQTLADNKTAIWFKRLVILYLFWMLVYSPIWFHPEHFSLHEIVKFFMQMILGYYHLWYIAGTIGAALILLLIRKLPTSALIVIILLTYFMGVAIQYAGNYHLANNPTMDKMLNVIFVHRNALFFSLPFFCIGFLINKYNIHKRVSFNTATFVSLLGTLLFSAEIYFNYVSPARDGGFDNFFSLLLLCPALFILFMQINLASNTKNLALYATAIYFVHPLFLLPLVGVFPAQATLLTLIVIALSVAAAYFLIAINKRVKFIL